MKRYFSPMRKTTIGTRWTATNSDTRRRGRRTRSGPWCTGTNGPVVPAKLRCPRECGARTARSSDFSKGSRNLVILCKISQFLKHPQKNLRSCVDQMSALECSLEATEHRLWGALLAMLALTDGGTMAYFTSLCLNMPICKMAMTLPTAHSVVVRIKHGTT